MLDYYFWYTYILLIAVWFVFKHWVKVIYEFKCIFFVSKFAALLVPWVTCLFLPLLTWTYMLPVPNFHTLRGENKCHSLQITLFFFFAMPCSLWYLCFLTRDWTWAMQVKAQSPNHWTTLEVCKLLTFRILHLFWSYFLGHVTCGISLPWERIWFS